MNVERNLPVVRERKLAILKGDPELCAQQKKAGKLLARERIAQLLDAASFVELDVLNADAGVVTGYGLVDGSPKLLRLCRRRSVAPISPSHSHRC